MDLRSDAVVLVIANEGSHTEVMKEAAAQLRDAGRLCVFALAKPSATLLRELKQSGLREEQLFFIDAVSGCKGVKSCARISAMEDLTGMSIAYTETIGSGRCGAALLPALNVLFAYTEPESLVKFVAALTQKTRAQNARLVIVTLWDEKDQTLLRDTFPFMDRIIDLRAKA